MAVSLLQRDFGGQGRLSGSEIESLRLHLRDCLEDLRGIANRLRPAVLAEPGLVPALERLCIENSERIGKPIALHVEGRLAGVPSGGETTAYRTLEEALRVVKGATIVSARTDQDDGRLTISVISKMTGHDHGEIEQELATARARLELLGGVLRVNQQPPPDAVGLALNIDIPLRQS